MFAFGFSYVGALTLALVFLPNILWTRCKPEGYDALAREEPKALLFCERTGQAAVTVLTLFCAGLNPGGCSVWELWLAGAAIAMLLYEICWYRYFKSTHTLSDFYGARFRLPVPLASLPVLALFFLSIYGRNVWLGASVVLLGIGHIGIHLRHYRAVLAQKS